MDDTLRAPGALGPGWEPSETGFTLGGGGGGLIGRRLWLGVKAHQLFLPSEPSDRGRASISATALNGEIGVAAVNRPHFLVIPYLAFGGVFQNVDVLNRTLAPMNIAPGETLAPGEERTFKSSFFTLDAAVRVMGLYFAHGGGMATGLDMGLSTSIAPNSYEGDTSLSGAPPARMTTGFIRLVIGGGGFYRPRD